MLRRQEFVSVLMPHVTLTVNLLSNDFLLSFFKFISFLIPHVTLTVDLLSNELFLMHFRRYSVSHVNQSRGMSTFEDWLSHGKAQHVLWWSVSNWIALRSAVPLSNYGWHPVLTNWNGRDLNNYISVTYNLKQLVMLLLIKSRVQPFIKTTNTVEEHCRF